MTDAEYNGPYKDFYTVGLQFIEPIFKQYKKNDDVNVQTKF